MEAVAGPTDLTHVPRVRRHELPAAAVGRRPDRLLEIARPGGLGGERRASEELAAGRQMDEIEDLSAVRGIGADQQLGRAEDDHVRGGAVEPRGRIRGLVATTTS